MHGTILYGLQQKFWTLCYYHSKSELYIAVHFSVHNLQNVESLILKVLQRENKLLPTIKQWAFKNRISHGLKSKISIAASSDTDEVSSGPVYIKMSKTEEKIQNNLKYTYI